MYLRGWFMVNVWQEPAQDCKTIICQLNTNKLIFKNFLSLRGQQSRMERNWRGVWRVRVLALTWTCCLSHRRSHFTSAFLPPWEWEEELTASKIQPLLMTLNSFSGREYNFLCIALLPPPTLHLGVHCCYDRDTSGHLPWCPLTCCCFCQRLTAFLQIALLHLPGTTA